MRYEPGPADIYCTNPACRQPYPRSLPSCPMCDWPTGKPFSPPPASVLLPPEPLQSPQPVQLVPVILHPRSHPVMAALRQVPALAWGIAAACVLVLLVWGAVNVWILREQMRAAGEGVQMIKDVMRETATPAPLPYR